MRIAIPRPSSGDSPPSPNGHHPPPSGGSRALAGAAVPAGGDPAGRSAPASISPPPKLRRRPALVALGVALIATGGATAAWLTTTLGHTQSVLAVRSTLDRGQVIAPEDLVTANINLDPALKTVPAGDQAQIVGKRAAVDLAGGTLITPESVTDSVIPAAGRSLVGLSLTSAQLPALPLRQGATIRVVDTPREQDDPPSGTPNSTTATVVQMHPPSETGELTVDVTVPSSEAVSLAARAATGRVAVVLDPADS